MKRQEAFTLLELMIVVAVIAIVASVAIPGLVNARKAGNEASAISSMRTLTTANNQYRTRFQVFASSLTNLGATGYIDSVLGSGFKSGYTFSYAGGSDTWTTNADPSSPGYSGDRGFFADESGVIRFVLTGAASATSQPID